MFRILTDRGTEYCGKVEQHDYELYLAVNDIDHTKTKAASRKQMVYVSVSIRRFCRSSIKLRLGRSFIAHWKNCKLI